jgi:hypothetical protein
MVEGLVHRVAMAPELMSCATLCWLHLASSLLVSSSAGFGIAVSCPVLLSLEAVFQTASSHHCRS